MRTVTKVAVSVDHDVMDRAERLRRRTRESRSALVSRALAQLLVHEEHAEQVRCYLRAYRDRPEREPDVELARALARRVVAALPWDAS